MFNQITNCFNSLLSSRIRSLISEPEIKAFESSANKSKKIFSETFAMSLMYSKINRGHRMEPCGTPHLIVNKLDLTPL